MTRRDIDLEAFLQKLNERLQELEKRKSSRANENKPLELDQSRMGRLTRMDAMQQQSMSQAASVREAQERQRIQSAIVRIERGEFGYCMNCGEDISENRLEVDPSAFLCIECVRGKSG